MYSSPLKYFEVGGGYPILSLGSLFLFWGDHFQEVLGLSWAVDDKRLLTIQSDLA